MNIKQASDASGVPSRNIRYYEQEGLLCPSRNPENDYRIYTDRDVHTLKLIRALRMLDMPLEDIRAVLQGRFPWPLPPADRQNGCNSEPGNWRALFVFVPNCSKRMKRSLSWTWTPG